MFSAINDNDFDLIITDVNMPEMGGISLIENVRTIEQYQTTPILVLTTESNASTKMQGKEAGATGWIVKPFNPEQLLDVVKKVCP